MTDRKPQNQDKFIIRLPDGMRERIKAAADQNNRSMNSEIVATLEEAYPAPYDPLNDQIVELMAILAKYPNDGRFDVLREGLEDMRTRYGPQMNFEQFGYEILPLLRAIVELYDIAVRNKAKETP